MIVPAKEEAVFKIAEIAADWKLSHDKVQQLFLNAYLNGETGILVTTGPKSQLRANRRMLRITESARFKMYTRLQAKAA